MPVQDFPDLDSPGHPADPLCDGRLGPGGFSHEEPDTCRAFRCFGFCSFGLECKYDHPREFEIPLKSLSVLLEELHIMGQEHSKGQFLCRICGNQCQGDASAPVGVTSWYRYCPQCGNFLFYPHVQLIMVYTLQKHRRDYLQYKRTAEEYCLSLPSCLHIPLLYEAHRWGVTQYAWSVFAPINAREILNFLFQQHPFTTLVSMGAGTGYVEHIIQRESKANGHPLQVLAYDENPPAQCHMKVTKGSIEVLDDLGDLSDTFLLLCWPPFGDGEQCKSTMASDATEKFARNGGRYLVYIGDIHATGDCRFHTMLWTEWELYPEVRWFTPLEVWVPERLGLVHGGHDSIGIYRYRDVPLDSDAAEPET